MAKARKKCSLTGAPIRQLNRQELLFKELYLSQPNLPVVQIALKAGYAKTTAYQQAWSWVTDDLKKVPMGKRMLWKAIKEAGRERAKRTKINADYVLKRFTEIDEMDVADIFDDEWQLKPISQWPKVWRTSISAIDVTKIAAARRAKDPKKMEQVIKSIKWPDKVKNLELLGKHVKVGAFSEVNVNLDISHEEWLKTLK